ncbi:MAG: hypothetical protein P1U75_04975 [Antarcticimicrobium sp.]|uniref:hypothetical protein n=1 Tax=Antarcticimicrobium sp. TaxID=2824147 RepID=UPI0026251B12|nr:hypothetical protein [Antarcticimicrobium sp.]MDF1716013.1 hypothetical protein [Antarcticimicrobium sp.]
MTRFTRHLAAGAMTLAALPASAQDQAAPPPPARPSFWQMITAERLATGAMHSVMTWARLLADIRYDQLSVDPVAARATLTGIEIVPLIPGLPVDACRITAARVTINGNPLDRIGAGRLRLVLDGMDIAAGCLPPEGANMLRGMGFATLHAPWAELDLLYDHASGGVRARLSADFDRLASLNLSADLDYVSYRMDFETEEPVVAADLTHAELVLRDLGAWTLAQNFLPPELKQPGALGPVIAGAVAQAMAGANGPEMPASEKQRGFATQAGTVAAGFAPGGRVVLSTSIADGPFRLDEASVESFRALFDALNPQVGARPTALQVALPVAALQAALNAEEPPADALAFGRALMTGIGAPRNPAQGLKLLLPLARAGNTEASLLIARGVAESQPANAYAHALRAAATNRPGALAILDRIERDLPYAQVIEAQNVLMAGPEDALYGDLAAMRAAARDFLTGAGRPRSWRAAYYWASMAAAAGDPSGAALRDEITETLRLRGDAAAWAAETESLENGVLRDWMGKDVPARLR